MKKLILNLTLIASTLFLMNSCVKDTYDGPDTGCIIETPTSGESISINDLLGTYTNGVIDKNVYIEGTVISDDKYGNFYKKIILQDSTGGIAINLNATGLSASYPPGRNIYILLEGLYINSYGEISANDDGDRIPVSLLDTYIKRGKCGSNLVPDTVALDDLNSSHVNKLVTVLGVEFVGATSGLTYADAVSQSTVNLDLSDCDNTIIVRTSGYAQFAGDTVPKGNGTATGVFNIFGSDYQLFLRGTEDVDMEAERCDGAGATVGLFSDDFTSQDFTTKNWDIQTVTGSNPWTLSDFGGGSDDSGGYYAKASNWNGSGNDAVESWLITPSIDLSSVSAKLHFNNASNYTGDDVEILVSTDYTGGSPSSGTWTDLGATLSPGGSWDWFETGDIVLPTGSNVRIAIKYVGSSSDGSTWEIDDFIVEEI